MWCVHTIDQLIFNVEFVGLSHNKYLRENVSTIKQNVITFPLLTEGKCSFNIADLLDDCFCQFSSASNDEQSDDCVKILHNVLGQLLVCDGDDVNNQLDILNRMLNQAGVVGNWGGL